MAYDSESPHDEYKYYLQGDCNVEEDSDTSSAAKSECNRSANGTGTSDGNISEHVDVVADVDNDKENCSQTDYPVSRLRVARDDYNTFIIANDVTLRRDEWIGLENPKPDSLPRRADVPLLTLTKPEQNTTYFLDDPVEYNIPDGPYMDLLIERRLDQICRILCLRKQARRLFRHQ